MPIKLQTYLINFEEEVKMRLENLSGPDDTKLTKKLKDE